jgi:MATE family multidrug resistance protein
MPVVSCAAFTWDGIYIGATASRALRNGMILSSAFFILSYLTLKGIMGLQALYLAYFVHLIIRTIYMSVMAKKEIYGLLD